jgi:hypothetical protein
MSGISVIYPTGLDKLFLFSPRNDFCKIKSSNMTDYLLFVKIEHQNAQIIYNSTKNKMNI